MIKPNDFVITNKGNHGKVMVVGEQTAKVKIGFKVHEIELQNLFKINDGTIFLVDYIINDNMKCRTNVFVKHGTILFDGNDKLLNLAQEILIKQLQLKEIKVLNILIP